jgi:hypothetical protein
MKRRNRYYLTFHHRKKLFYVISSLILSGVLLFIGMFDIIAVTVLQNPNLSTHKFMKTVLVRKCIITKLILLRLPYTCRSIYNNYRLHLSPLRYYMQSRFTSHSLASFTPMNQSIISYQKWRSLLEVCD